jgi:CDGSH-type Zn-finger protein
LKECWASYKAGPSGHEIEGGPEALRGFFQASLNFPQVGFLVLVEDETVRGFAILTETSATMPTPCGTSVRMVLHGFVRGIHIQPGVGLKHSLAMEQAICRWGRSRNYPFLTGHCSEGYLSRAERPYTRLGWYKTHTVVLKNL